MKQIHCYITAFLLFSVILLPCVASADSCSTAKCHPDIAKGKVTHEPVRVGECENCHQANSPVHPSGKGADFSLAANGNALCFACHDSEDFIGKYEHGPSVSGSCLYCHSPHTAKYKKLLRKSPQDTCFSCHDDFGKSLQEAAFVHSAIDELDCGACHDPHASSIPRLLKGETTTLCLKCHDDIEAKYKRSLQKHEPLYSGSQCANCHSAHFADYQALLLIEGRELCLNCHGDKNNESTSALRNIREEIEDKLVIHPPIEDEGCSGCHDPHGSGHDALLNGPYPGTVYAPYDEDAYDLCFQCHDKELLTSKNSESATDFRNGPLNLHNLHVAIERKGRTCKACHMSHGSDGEKLINPEGIPFGSWKIPVRFEMTENGGSCIPGCHQGMVYDREEAYDNSKKDIEEEE